ncbi:MAG: TonB-dependent receptor [Rhodanobacter sp.]
MIDESTPFGWQAARKRRSAAAEGVRDLRHLPALGLLSLAIVLAHAAPVHAQNVGETRDYAISSQPLSTALNQLALAADRQIMVPPELVRGRTAPSLAGHYSLDAALRHLLTGSGLTYEVTGNGTVIVKQAPPNTPRRPAKPAPAMGQEAGQEAGPSILESVTVTGTRIRGGDAPSPVITIGSERIRQEGFATLGDVVRSLPQNYSGGQNPGVIPFTISGAGGQNTNVTGGSALNLRGLGQDASLTLLNGRRMAYGGVSQGVDISAIPVEAVERIEIVPDGASAIYGSDAVGGVANVILRRSFDGASVSARRGGATDGGLGTREYAATAGTTWASGGLMATVKDVSTDPIYARQRAYTAQLRDPWTLYPESRQRSGLLGAHQQLGSVAELSLDAFKTTRSQRYGVYNDVGNQYVEAAPDTATWMVSPGLSFFLPNDWTLSAAGAWARNRHRQYQSTKRLATGAVSVTDICVCTGSRVAELSAEGPLFALPAGDARLAVGAGHRRNDFLEYNRVSRKATIEGDEASRFAYVELNMPLLGSGQDMGNAQRLELSVALRNENYESFGGVSTPKLGVVYRPGADFTLKGSWGKSFKAPTLYQLLRSEQVVLRTAQGSGGAGFPSSATVLYLDGGNPELKPERAHTWTASAAFHPQALPGLETELTWFDIDYTGRVVQPITDPTQALSNPAYAEFVQLFPTPAEQAAIIARDGDGVITNQAGKPYDPNNVVGVVYFHFRNAVAQRIRGADLSGSYRLDLGSGRLTLRGSASWLRSTQRFSTTRFDLAGTLHNPPTFAGRLGAVWSAGPVTASAFLNHKAGLKNVVAHERTASFTTVDTTLRYAWGSGRDAAPDWEAALSLQNVFNRTPPLHTIGAVTPFQVPPYDATNFSPIGRFASVAVTKHW